MNKLYRSFHLRSVKNCCLFAGILVMLTVSTNVFADRFNLRREAGGALKDTVAVARGDFNNDNIPDLVQITVDFQIAVLKGYGNGSFGFCSSTAVSTTAGVRDVAVGDFNQDGKLDAVVAHFGNIQVNQVSVFTGNGNCGLGNETVYHLNARADARAIAVGDFTGDGWPDIAVTSFTEPPAGQFYLMKNNGAGLFPNGFGYSFFGFPDDIKAGFLNSDRHLDVAIASGGGATIYYGVGDGSFNLPETTLNSLTTTHLTIGDFNSDGLNDIAAAVVGGTSTVNVFLNSNTGFPGTYQSFPVSHTVRSITSADLNNDGKLDVATTNGNFSTLNEVNILYGNGNGTLQSYLVEKGGTEPLDIIAGDLNGDSKIELIVGNCCGSPDTSLGVFQNSPNQARYFTDFDGDRKSEVAIVRPDAQAVWWVLKSSNSTHYAVSFGYGTDKIVPANYDGTDAKADIAVYRNGTWYILNSSDGIVRTEYFGLSTDKPAPADYDNDGYMDIAVYRPTGGLWCIKQSSNGVITYTNFGLSTDNPVAADYDGDGRADIAVYRSSDNQWYLLQSKDGYVQVASPGGAGDKPVQGDYDADGKADLAAASASTWYVRQSSTSSVVSYPVTAYQKLAPGEYTGDSKNDVASFNAGVWTIRKSEDGTSYTVNWGLTGDIPVPSAYVP